MKLAVLFSGGKDSCLALFKIMKSNKYEVKYLLNIYPTNPDSFMFHKSDLRLLEKQANRLGIKLIIEKSKGEKEKELDDLKNLLEKVRDEIDGVVVGGIASSYQGERIKKICRELGLEFIAPLWNYSGEGIWKEILQNGFKIILTKISCEGLGEEWLGKVIDKKNFEEMKKLSKRFGFRLDFEGGEAETAVLFMPGFQKQIKIDFDIKSEGKYRHFLKIKKVR